MQRYLCIHGHFYQPPRENPWLEAVELQDSAYPYHDWNERITAECYAPNGVARLLDGDGRIAALMNNYAHMSFNFGPTLLSWLQEKSPEVYRTILDADRESQGRFSGHGSAIAQAYNHIILPLANRRDKVTQVVWGIGDFEHRFHRKPEGMWLPETAVDLETLDVLAEHGIRFTILSPYQAGRVRPLGSNDWVDVVGGRIDPTMAYLHKLPSGRSICLFFYDGPISQAVAFEKLLLKGEYLVDRLRGGFSDARPWPQLVHIATDGESYGHHHSHGDMALAYALHSVARNHQDVKLTNYGEFLERHLPTHEVEIIEKSAWSCSHGVDRWRADCGCNSGRAGWNQQWRQPLREAFDTVRDTLAPLFEKRGRQLLRDPWAARNAFIQVLLDRRPERMRVWLQDHAVRELDQGEITQALKLLEMQRQALLMYTSCGWFFDEISGIETVQCLRYAGRAVQLGQELFNIDLQTPFLKVLAQAPSNVPEHGNGRVVYEKFVQTAALDWERIGAHYAVSSLFENYTQETRFFCYTADRERYQSFATGKSRLVLGQATITSALTTEAMRLSFGVLHLGDHHVNCGVGPVQPEASEAQFTHEVSNVFTRGDFAQVIRLLDRRYSDSTYSLKSLFHDEQRKVIKRVLRAGLSEAENVYRRLHEQNLPTMRFLSSIGVPFPPIFQATAEFLLNSELRWDFKDEEPNLEHIRHLMQEASLLHVPLDTAGLAYRMKTTIGKMAERFRSSPQDPALLHALLEVVGLVKTLPFPVDMWRAQNIYFESVRSLFGRFLHRLVEGERPIEGWLRDFIQLGLFLGVRVVEMQQKVDEALALPDVGDVVREVLTRHRVPRATYRFQFNKTFTFRDALAQVPYLHELGISDCYASPLWAARPGSMHGYDICDHSRLNPELGTMEDFNALTDALRERRMGLILDVVPNHMGIGHTSNHWWFDVLENGPSSIYAGFFDITWNPINRNLENKVLLPILEDQYGEVLESGKIRLVYENGSFSFHYHDHVLPVSPCSYIRILEEPRDTLIATGELNENPLRELQSILTALNYLPPRTATEWPKIEERNREKEVIKKRLAKLTKKSAAVLQAIERTVQEFNGKIGHPASFDRLDALIDAQAYRPADWRVATEEINYRRFFDINELAALRIEAPDVFEATHRLLFQLIADGKVTGVRIDHPDGLWDPTAYFRRLQEECIRGQVRVKLLQRGTTETAEQEINERIEAELREREQRPNATWPLYVVAEKILCDDEELPRTWAIAGTTGYDFLCQVNGLFINTDAEAPLTQLHREFVGRPVDFQELTNLTRKRIMLVSLASEINALSQKLDRISESNRRYRDFTLNGLTFVIREILACLTVYRTYITGPEEVSLRDRLYVEHAVEKAKQRNPRTAESVFDFVRDVLLLRNIHDFREEDRPALVEWTMKFQQVSGPVMAKGIEDTALYVYNRLVSLNEVGGHPDHFGTSIAAFHKANLERSKHWPHAQLTTSTHDTKRSEGVRARLNALSEIPEHWAKTVTRWRDLNASKKTEVDGEPAPDGNDEYLLYQTMLGVWPLGGLNAETLPAFRDRIQEYMQKATKEAKVHTSWVNANREYDEAVRDFVKQVVDDAQSPFLSDVSRFQSVLTYHGFLNSLSQTVLKLTCPGVPDFYQGTELWDFHLVDPDNRRLVDYPVRHETLARLKDAIERNRDDLRPLAQDMLRDPSNGRIKLFVIERLLGYRRDHSEVFADGDYLPLDVNGPQRDHAVALLRRQGDQAVAVVAPRLIIELTEGLETLPMGGAIWQDTWLVLPTEEKGRPYQHLFTGERWIVGERDDLVGLPLGSVLGQFPVAVLVRVP